MENFAARTANFADFFWNWYYKDLTRMCPFLENRKKSAKSLHSTYMDLPVQPAAGHLEADDHIGGVGGHLLAVDPEKAAGRLPALSVWQGAQETVHAALVGDNFAYKHDKNWLLQ